MQNFPHRSSSEFRNSFFQVTSTVYSHQHPPPFIFHSTPSCHWSLRLSPPPAPTQDSVQNTSLHHLFKFVIQSSCAIFPPFSKVGSTVRVQEYLQTGPEGQQSIHEVAGYSIGLVHVDVHQHRPLADVAHHCIIVLQPQDKVCWHSHSI